MADLNQKSLRGKSGIGYASRALLQLYPLGLKLFVMAPLALALVIVPELLQHVAEINLGMFDSSEAFKTHQADASRMTFGYAKIVGLVLAILASARVWWTHETGSSWMDLRQIAWGRLTAGALIFIGIGSLPALVEAQVGSTTYQFLSIGWSLILLPFLFLLLAGLFGDRSTSITDMVRHSWPWLLLTAVLLILGFAPSSWVHQMNHHWAMGEDASLVWALMIFDSLLVGLLAGLTGTALYLGYAGFAGTAVRRPEQDLETTQSAG